MDTHTLRQLVKPLEQFFSDGGDQWGEKIFPQKLTNARKSHNRDLQEYIFYLSEFAVWGSAIKSVIATETGISAKYADELPPLFLPWKDVDVVQLMPDCSISLWVHGKCYVLRMFQDQIKNEYLDVFNSLAGEEASDYLKEAGALEDICKQIGEINIEEIDSARSESISSCDAISRCDGLLNVPLTSLETKYNNLEECTISSLDYYGIINLRAYFLCASGNSNHAKTDLLGYVDKCRTLDLQYVYQIFFNSCILLSEICTDHKEVDDAIVILNIASKMDFPEFQRQAKERLQKASDLKMRYLLEAPRDCREIILCVDDIPVWPIAEFRFADPRMLRDMNWKFEPGHPQAGELYVCHPLRPDMYYDVQSFHDKLFDEKRSELVYLLECVGARHLHVEAMTGTSIEKQKDATKTGIISYQIMTSASADMNKDVHDQSRLQRLQLGIDDRQLNPTMHPHIPEDLIWYPHEQSWQRIAKSALAKRYRTLSVELQYHEDFSINSRRITQIQAALKLFSRNIEIGWNAEVEERLRLRKATLWNYTATFEEETEIEVCNTNVNYKVEAEYTKYLIAACSAGVIPESARKILERQRIKLGLSAERATELEQTVKELYLTEDEKEYLQDLQDCYVDGALAESSRCLLTRRRQTFGISEERAEELKGILADL